MEHFSQMMLAVNMTVCLLVAFIPTLSTLLGGPCLAK
jgi:hypothetical protein